MSPSRALANQSMVSLLFRCPFFPVGPSHIAMVTLCPILSIRGFAMARGFPTSSTSLIPVSMNLLIRSFLKACLVACFPFSRLLVAGGSSVSVRVVLVSLAVAAGSTFWSRLVSWSLVGMLSPRYRLICSSGVRLAFLCPRCRFVASIFSYVKGPGTLNAGRRSGAMVLVVPVWVVASALSWWSGAFLSWLHACHLFVSSRHDWMLWRCNVRHSCVWCSFRHTKHLVPVTKSLTVDLAWPCSLWMWRRMLGVCSYATLQKGHLMWLLCCV